MIRLLEKTDLEEISKKYGIDKNYLSSLLDNMNEYMYVIVGNEICGFMICLDNGECINIKRINGDSVQLLRHLIFNANKDIKIDNEIDGLSDYNFSFDGKKYIRKYEEFRSNNIEIFDYYEKDIELRRKLLNQINEPLWKGAKDLYERVKNNEEHGKLFIMYDIDKDHIISFGTLQDFDEIKSDELKPWIGSIYTFRPYRGNRYSEKLIKLILQIAKNNGNQYVYLSSDNKGMYEKFGFKLYGMMKTVKGNETQVFVYDTRIIK